MIKIKFYSFKCNIPYLNIFLNRILVDLEGDSGDFSGDSGDSGGDSGDSAVIPGNRVTPEKVTLTPVKMDVGELLSFQVNLFVYEAACLKD